MIGGATAEAVVLTRRLEVSQTSYAVVVIEFQHFVGEDSDECRIAPQAV